MTTIIYRDGVLAADSQMTCGDTKEYLVTPKIWHVGVPDKEGRRFRLGVAGDPAYGVMLTAWADKLDPAYNLPFAHMEQPLPDPRDNGHALLVHPDGRYWLIEHRPALILHNQPWMVIGNGVAVATGALAMGATAAQAVGIACKYDIYTGGKVVTLHALPQVEPNGDQA